MHGEDRHLRRGGFNAQIEQGGLYVGSPATVRARLQDALDVTGSNYFAGAFAFGSLTADQTLRSLRLFTEEVIPTLR
jgi:alkanesulfonate monooxygenase SsuD/methylene tetrahydromethanopterin reductase-like flavin-dependent oxidoreductase (luciferase family)